MRQTCRISFLNWSFNRCGNHGYEFKLVCFTKKQYGILNRAILTLSIWEAFGFFFVNVYCPRCLVLITNVVIVNTMEGLSELRNFSRSDLFCKPEYRYPNDPVAVTLCAPHWHIQLIAKLKTEKTEDIKKQHAYV